MPTGRRHITSVLEDEAEVKDFIHGGKKPDQKASRLAVQEARGLDGQPSEERRKISIRLPLRLDDMLSQVSNERIRANRQGKLATGEPREKQEIVAEALQDWFEKHGYLTQKDQ